MEEKLQFWKENCAKPPGFCQKFAAQVLAPIFAPFYSSLSPMGHIFAGSFFCRLASKPYFVQAAEQQ
jgi:hypothetical protein